MSGARSMLFSIFFKGDATGAKAAAAEAKTAVAAVTAEAKSSVTATDQDTAAQQKNAQARRDTAAAATQQAEAERRAREAAQRSNGPAIPGPAPAAVPPGLPLPDMEALKARYVPAFAAQKAYEKELVGIAEAERAGALTAGEAAAAQTRLRAGYERTTESLRRADAALGGNTGAMKLQSHEARLLAMQVNDTFQTLALGMSPLQVLLQQGPQVADILGGWGRTTQFLRQSLTGMRVLMGGTAAAVIAGAMAWDQYLSSMKAVEIAAAGRGANLGVSPGMLGRIAEEGGRAANLSTPSSRGLLAQLVSSGQIGAENLEGVLGISSDLAVTLGVQADAIGGKLIEMFSKPGQAAANLRATNSMLTASQVEQIQTLESQNQKYAAQALLLTFLEEKLVDAERAKTGLGRAMGTAGRGASNVWDAGGALVNDAYDSGSLNALLNPNPMNLGQAVVDIGSLRQSKADDAALVAQVADGLAEAWRPTLEANEKGKLALDLASRANANAIALRAEALRNEVLALQAGMAAGDLSIKQRQLLTDAIFGQVNALDALEKRHQLGLASAQRELQIATERNPMRRAELLAVQALVAAHESGASLGDMFAAADLAKAQAMNEIIGGAANQSAAMVEEAAARTRLNALVAQGAVSSADAAGWLEREMAVRPLLAAAARAEGDDKARLTDEINKLTGAYAELAGARMQEAYEADAKSVDGRIAKLQLETSLIGRSNAERTRALAVAEAERRMRTIGIDPADPRFAEARRQALAEAEAQIERDRVQRQYDLRNQQIADAYGASARLARTPVERAEIEAQAAYAAAIAQTGDADEAAARAAQVRSRALAELRGSVLDLTRAQDEQMNRLRLEAQLAGATEAARARALAVYQAELEIKQMGLDLNDQMAVQMRAAAAQIADQQRQTTQLVDAWDQVRSAAEAAIDAPFDALLDGDLKGAALAAVKEIGAAWMDLAWKNPLKNRLLGTDYATIDDMGGLGGVIGTLFGGRPQVTASQMNAASMAVTTPMVNLTAANMTGMPSAGMMPGGANIIPFPGAAQIPGAPGDLNVLRSVATGGALRPDALTGLQGPFAGQLAAMVTDAQAQFGADAVRITSAFRSVARQAELWEQALAKYGSAAEARKWVAPPGHSNHNRGMAADLDYGSPAVQDWFHANAAKYGLGYRMGNEPWHIEPVGAGQRGRAALETDAAMSRLAETTTQAQAQLGQLGTGAQTLGTGMQQMTAGLAGTLQGIGASYGPGGAFVGGLLGEGLKWMFGGGAAAKSAAAKPGFMAGGYTGAGATTDVAGVVHAEEYVFDAASTRKIGVANLEALRRGALKGYRSGGYVVSGRAPLVASSSAGAAAPSRGDGPVVTMNLQVSGTGNTEIREGVQEAIKLALEQYDRDALPGRLRILQEDKWGA